MARGRLEARGRLAIVVIGMTLAAASRTARAGDDGSPRELVVNLKELAAPVSHLDVRLDAGVAASLPQRGTRAAFNVEIATRFDFWYGFGVSTAPPTAVTTTTTTPPIVGSSTTITRNENALAFSARLFKRIGPAVISGGMVDSRAGFAVELRGWDDRIRVELALADAQPWRTDALPGLRAGGSAQWGWLYVQAGAQDLLEPALRAAYAGAGLRWSDPDLRYLIPWVTRR
jgi:phospholipid/cholesterol/gamma-HCH transport system substrate-binding protein